MRALHCPRDVQFSDYVAATSGVISLVAIAVSILVARSQNALIQREQLIPFVNGVLDEFHSTDFKEALAYVKFELPKQTPHLTGSRDTYDEALATRVRPVSAYFNEIGMLVAEGAVSRHLVASVMGGSVVDAWKVLAPYVYDRRLQPDANPEHYAYFEHLAALLDSIPAHASRRALGLKRYPPAP